MGEWNCSLCGAEMEVFELVCPGCYPQCAKPPTTLNAAEVSFLMKHVADMHGPRWHRLLIKLETMNREFLDELRSNVAADEDARDEEIFNAERTDDGTV